MNLKHRIFAAQIDKRFFMINTFKYNTGILANTTIRAVIASTCIVFIGNGEANPVPDRKG